MRERERDQYKAMGREEGQSETKFKVSIDH